MKKFWISIIILTTYNSVAFAQMTLEQALKLPVEERIKITYLATVDAEKEGHLLKDIPEIPNLKYLTITNLKEFTRDILDMRRLQDLAIINSSFKTLPEMTFLNLMSLEDLVIDADLVDIPDSYENLKTLKRLNLKSNQLTKIPKCLFKIQSLTKIQLTDNQIDSVPNEIKKLVLLEGLGLGKNNIEYVSPEVFNLPNLRSLAINHNRIKEIKDEINGLSTIKFISLQFNDLKTIPKGFGKLINLEGLFLEGNPIEDVPDEVLQATNLQFIYISDEKISKEKFKELRDKSDKILEI